MTSTVPIKDEDLVAYLDGALEDGRRTEIEAALAQDATLGRRLAALDIDKEALRAAFEAVAATAPTERLHKHLDWQAARLRWRRARSPWVNIAAAVVLGVALGYVVGFSTADDAPKSWQSAIADYQALYTNATLASIPDNVEMKRREIALVSMRIGLPLTLEALQVPGLEFKRAQILEFKGRPLAQFAFLDQSGRPIAFCVIHSDTPDGPIRLDSYRGLPAALWSRNGYGFIVIGGTQSEALERVATTLASQL